MLYLDRRYLAVISLSAITSGLTALLFVGIVYGWMYYQFYQDRSNGAFSTLGLPAEQAIVKVASYAQPSVVSIVQATNEDSEAIIGDDVTSRVVSGGSGFFVSKEGLIVTNEHVIDNEKKYEVRTAEGKRYLATLVDKDPTLDIAVLKVMGENFPYLEFGDSDEVQVGQTAIAIGNALGELSNSVSVGVISGLSRSIVAGDSTGRTEMLEEVIQTDAAINPGNSGGPLLDLNGKVIGVNVAVARGFENIGFALPASVVEKIVDSVERTGKVSRPFLGVWYRPVTPELASELSLPVSNGVLLIREDEAPAVAAGSPAQTAGLKSGDLITEIDGQAITGKNPLSAALRKKDVGDEILLTIYRNGTKMKISVTLEASP